MRTLLNATIRKITIGDSKMGMTYQVEKDYGKVTIASIVRDENSFFLNGSVTYIIYVRPVGASKDTDEQIWKYFERQPVTVECDIDKPL